MMAASFPDIKIGLGSGNKIKLSSYIQPDNTPNINTNSYQSYQQQCHVLLPRVYCVGIYQLILSGLNQQLMNLTLGQIQLSHLLYLPSLAHYFGIKY